MKRPATLGSGTPREPIYFFFAAFLAFFLAVFFAAFLFLAITYSFGLWLEAYMEKGAGCPVGTALAKQKRQPTGCLSTICGVEEHPGKPGNHFPEGRFVPMLLIIFACCQRKPRSIQNCRIPLPKRL
jgi:hypothetical protein